VKTNKLIWDIISPQAQSVERKMQIIQRAIVKASTVLVNTVNKMAATDENINDIDGCNDALAILGHTNRKVNITRRELMKPEMCSEYVDVCAQSVEYTSFLFSDDVQKRAKEIENCSKISLAMVAMDIADCIPVEVVLAHMVEGEEVEGYVEAEEAVVL
jgi:hypothetical protein